MSETNTTKAEMITWLETKIAAFDWAQENVSPNKEDFEENAMLEAILEELKK